MKRSLQNQNGFGLVSFLALMPLLLALLSLVSGWVLLLKTDAKLKHECRTQLLEAQHSISEQLNQVIANNKIGEGLRYERIAAELAVKATLPFPPAHAAAQAELAAVKARQLIYKMNQQRLILLARAHSKYAPYKTSFAVKSKLNEDMHAVTGARAWPRTKTNSPVFEINETPQGDDSPSYEPAPDFTPKQEMKVSLEIDLAAILPEWLTRFLPKKNLKLKTECNATLEKENQKWIEKLSAVR